MNCTRSQIASPVLFFCALLLSGCTNLKSLKPLVKANFALPPKTVTLKMTGYTPTAGKTYKDFMVINYSVKAAKGNLSYVTSRDGLADELKNSLAATYGFSATGPNSANPNFSDLMLYLSGIILPQQGLLYCAPSLTGNTSNDAIVYTDSRTGLSQFIGLRDCEKSYLGLNPTLFDNDGDGLPDYLELRCGMNPKNAYDANLSIPGDGVTNLEKCKRNIPVDENANSQPNLLYGYHYKTELMNDGSRTITVSNIPILNEGKDNFLAFYLIETNNTGLQNYIYTAYTNLNAGVAGRILQFPFWVTDPTKKYNQEVIFP